MEYFSLKKKLNWKNHFKLFNINCRYRFFCEITHPLFTTLLHETDKQFQINGFAIIYVTVVK